ncbi:MAG: HD domain-containing protein [Candidatus Marinimicrobia bacterium]|nr:HD domain-containing protein [Candidatus Neomarinimicrobiota bacterium]
MKSSNITNNEINLPELELLHAIGGLADEKGIEVYLVGGAVRDAMLSKTNFDLDIVVVSDGIKFAKQMKKTLNADSIVAWEKFGTAELTKGNLKIEVATARSEEYVKSSRKPTVEPADIQTDLRRRDFTINSMAVRLNEAEFGNLIDPFGGREDLEKKVLKTPLDPVETFDEDPLRMLRAIRFSSQLGFEIDSGVIRAIRKEKERLSIVSQERITSELLKILASPKPSVGIAGLLGSELLEIVLPEMIPTIGVEQVGRYHHKDVFWHTLEVLDNLAEMSEDLDLRFSALVHDIAKPDTKEFKEDKGWTFHGHEVLGSRMVEDLGRRLKLSNKTIKFAKKMTYLHLRPIALVSEEVTDSAVRRLIVEAGDDVESLMLLCRADITTKNPDKADQYMRNFEIVEEKIKEVLEKDEMKAFQSPVRGEEIMKICQISEGIVVGKIKNVIEQAILDGVIPNDYDASYDYLIENKDKWLSEFKSQINTKTETTQ